MKRLFILLAALLAATALRAQIDRRDSVIYTIPLFSAGDTMTYRYTQLEYRIADGDTTLATRFVRRFTMRVAEAGRKGYRLEYTLLDTERGTADSADFKSRMLTELARRNRGAVLRLQLDRYGRIERLTGWKELSKRFGGQMPELVDTLCRQLPMLDSLFDRRSLQSLLRLACSSEEGIRGTFSEIDQLFAWHARAVPFAETVSESSPGDAGYPFPTTVTVEARAEENDDYSIRMESVQTVSEAELKALTGAVLGALASGQQGERLADELDRQQFGPTRITDRVRNDYFHNGWPRSLCTERLARAAGRGKIIRRLIEWEGGTAGR